MQTHTMFRRSLIRSLTCEQQQGVPSCLPSLLRQFASSDESTIQIDRSGLLQPQPHSHTANQQSHKETETPMAKHLKSIIKFRGGPITLAEYMSEVLINPNAGYYTQRDVFGVGGDFITSPEISQMFGEMIGIWCVAMWQQLGQPPSLRLVELGPGRGTLMADLLRGTSPFASFTSSLHLNMVEVSPVLRKLQYEALRCGDKWDESAVKGVSGWSGSKVEWYRSLDEVPQDGCTLFIAHEFFDALPVHQFQQTERGWCERLVDMASEDSPLHLRLVLSPGPTAGTKTVLPRRLQGLNPEERARCRAIEVSPQSMALAQSLAHRVARNGGAALIIDYGKPAAYEHSLQAIKDHRFVGLLEQPGLADLSAHVDFDALRYAATGSSGGKKVADWYGTINQRELLLGLGIEARLQQLVETASEEEAHALITGFMRLVGTGNISLTPLPMDQEADGQGSLLSGGDKASSSASLQSSNGLILPPGATPASTPTPGVGARKIGGGAILGDKSGASKQEGMGLIYKAACIVPAGAPPPVVFGDVAGD